METELFIARVNDTADICERTGKPKFMGFLSVEESVLANKLLSKRNIRFKLFGGYDDAERLVLCCLPDWLEDTDFPIVPITFEFRKSDKLGHRDFLGSLMALGIKRETVGDILIGDGRAVVFVLSEISDYILSEVRKIGKIGVLVKSGYDDPLPQKSELKEFSETVASLRLDCVVSALAAVSRSIANEKINLGLVAVNSVTVVKPTKFVSDGDIVTVRGSGKYIIESTADLTKKKRTILKYKKYI